MGANGVPGFGVLHSWSRRISRSPSAAAAAVLRAALVVTVVVTLIALDVVRNTDDAARSVRLRCLWQNGCATARFPPRDHI